MIHELGKWIFSSVGGFAFWATIIGAGWVTVDLFIRGGKATTVRDGWRGWVDRLVAAGHDSMTIFLGKVGAIVGFLIMNAPDLLLMLKEPAWAETLKAINPHLTGWLTVALSLVSIAGRARTLKKVEDPDPIDVGDSSDA